jgi:hypothetical protein
MSNRANPQHFETLKQVVTMAEAARLVYRDCKSIRYAIDAGNVAAVRCGRIWLVSVPSLLANFPVSGEISS